MSNSLFCMNCHTYSRTVVTILFSLISIAVMGLLSPAFAQVASNTTGIHSTSNTTQDTIVTIPSHFKDRVERSEVIVVAKIVGWTTPLKSLKKEQNSGGVRSTGFELEYNTAIHFVIVESLKGPYRVGDTVGYLQYGGTHSMSTADLIRVPYGNSNAYSGEYLLYLTPYTHDRKKSIGVTKVAKSTAGTAVDKSARIGPTEVSFPVFTPSGAPYKLQGDKAEAVGCLYGSEVLFPGSLSIARHLIKRLIK